MLTSSAPSTLVSSSSINASIQRPLRSQPRMALFNTTTSAVTPRRSREGEKHLKTWDWIHLTQFPSAVEQLSRSLFLVLNGCFRGKLEASKTLDLDLKSFKQISCGYLPCGWVCPGTHTLTWSFTVRSSWSNARALSLQGKDRCTVHWTCNELKI